MAILFFYLHSSVRRFSDQKMRYSSVIVFFAATSFVGTAGSSEIKYIPHDWCNEDTEEMSRDDFEGNLAVSDQSSKQLCIENFMFTYIKGVLNITFTSPFTEECYVVVLEGINSVSSGIRYVFFKKCVEHLLTYDGDSISEETCYIFNVISTSDAEEITKSEPFCLKAYKTEQLDCTSWSVSISLNAIPNQHSVNVLFLPAPKYQLCFKNYTVQLYRFDETCQVEDASLNKTKEVVYYNSKEVRVTFEDLSPGNYCTTVAAKHQNCLHKFCGKIVYEIPVELPELKKPPPDHLKSKTVNLILVTVLPLSILALVITGGVIGTRKLKNSSTFTIFCLVKDLLLQCYDSPKEEQRFWKCSSQHFRPKIIVPRSRSRFVYQLQAVESSCGQEHPGNTAGNEETVIVSILHAQCIELQREVDLALYNFLKDCCNVHPVISEDNPEVFMDISEWIRRNFNYQQLLKERVLHKVLILETDAAGRLYEHFRNLGEDGRFMLTYRHYSHLNFMFLRGLTELLASPGFFGTDHYHIVVVSFPYCTNQLSCFSQKRLYLPHQMVELYNSLWNKQTLLQEEENLRNKWKERETYKRLLVTIEQMQNYVEENPNYLDNCIFEYTQTV